MKNRLVVALLAVFTPLMIVAALLSSQAFLLRCIHWSMEEYTDYKLELDNLHIDVFRQSASADALQVFAKSGGPAIAAVSNVDARFKLMDIYRQDLANTDLRADNVQIFVSMGESVDDPEPLEWLEYLGWLPKQLEVGQLHVIFEALETWVFHVEDIKGVNDVGMTYDVTGRSRYGVTPLEIDLQFIALLQQESVTGLSLKGEMLAINNDAWMTFDGQVSGDREDFSYSLEVDSHTPQVKHLLSVLESGIDLEGSLALGGLVEGDIYGFTISNAKLKLDNTPFYDFHASGTITALPEDEVGLDLSASGEMQSLELLVSWIDVDLTSLGTAQASGNVLGTVQKPVLDDVRIETRSADGLDMDIYGTFTLALDAPVGEIPNDELQVEIRGPRLNLLQEWIGVLPYEPGPWRARGTLYPTEDGIGISNLIADAGTGEELQVHFEGDVAEVANLEELGLAGITGVNLSVSGYTSAAAKLAALGDLDIPPLQLVQGSAVLSGNADQLQLSAGQLSVIDSDLEAEISNIEARIEPLEESPLATINAKIQAELSDLSALSQYVTQEIPVLGAVTLNAQFLHRPDRSSLLNIEGHMTSEEGLKVDTTGEILDLSDIQLVDLHSRFSELNSRRLLEEVIPQFQYDGPLGLLKGSFALSREREEWRVHDIEVAMTGQSVLGLAAKGQVEDLLGAPRASLSARLSVSDPGFMHSITGLKIAASKATLKLESSPDSAHIDLQGVVGESQITSSVNLGLNQQGIASLAVKLESPKLRLQDFDLQAREESSGEIYRPAEQIAEAVPKGTLERMVENIPEYPTDIRLQVGNVVGEVTEIGRVDLHLTGVDKRHALRRLTINYQDTVAEIRGVIDLNPSPPVLSLGGEVLSVKMSETLADLGIESDVQGTLSVRTGLSASGMTTEELLQSLDGSLAFALEEAEVKGAAYDVLATDFLGWLYSGAALEPSTQIQCTRAKFDVRNGQARSDNLYMETRQMVASGDGHLDLVNNELDLSITPKSKTRIGQIPNAIRISGPMDDPGVKISPISTYANFYSEILLIVPNFFMRLFGIERTPGDGACLAALYE